MKAKVLSVFLLATVLLMTGCRNDIDKQSQVMSGEGNPVVYASIYPMYDFAKNIGKDKIDLRMVVPAGAEPHDWEPTAKVMVQMEEADVFIYNGVGMETWADNIFTTLANDKLIIVEASRGIDLLKFHGHEHDKEHEEQDEEHDEGGHHHGEYDPHVWLDPIRAIKQAENIKDALIQADESNRDFYEANYQEFADKLKALDARYKEALSNVKRKEIVVAHAAFGYIADRYGLEQIPVSGLNPQEEPSAAKLVQITQLLREKDIKYVFFETLTSPKLSEVLANEVGARTAVLNPIGGLTQEEIDAGKDYITVMEENLETLKAVLGE
ncbi:MAG: Zinc ABC transporter, substrate-binding protein ZnuA [Firmicutes bacterium]|nr:Zinc ABC transporter, substrate-binding protein ZnuA [Bacillota bacterium]MDI6707038.1 metal ABC transporter substrate-binding protein [Bacillota bacterium]